VGVNPFWKLAPVFKCLTDTVMVLDDFKTALDRLWLFWRCSVAGMGMGSRRRVGAPGGRGAAHKGFALAAAAELPSEGVASIEGGGKRSVGSREHADHVSFLAPPRF
jgi:hypothetical protein